MPSASPGSRSSWFDQESPWKDHASGRVARSFYGTAALLLILAVLFFVCVSLAALPSTAHADAAWGVRFGVSSGPDQVLFGGHVETGYVAPSLLFVPSVTLGFGDNVTVLQGNADLHYMLPLEGSALSLYSGGGFGLAFTDYHSDVIADNTSTNAGINVLFGVKAPPQNSGQFFVEARAGFIDLPDFELLAGFTFH